MATDDEKADMLVATLVGLVIAALTLAVAGFYGCPKSPEPTPAIEADGLHSVLVEDESCCG